MTVTIENLYTGNGSTTDYSFTFPYLDTTDIKVSLATVATTAYSLLNATTVRFDSAPGNGVAIRIYRETAFDTPKATFYPGSAIRANDLNDNTLQNLYVNQESNDKVADAWLTGDPTVISTESWYTTDDTKIASTKAIEGRIDAKIDTALTGDVAAGNKITITDNSPSSGQITVALTSGSLVNSDVNASAAIAGTKISPDFGSQNIATTGTVDGRDVSADGTKLDGIESGATADQSNAEIRTAVEAATDSNVFTDADHTKLNAIEDNATRDQTAAEIRTLVESASDSNVFTDADHTKLNAIEALATADQTAAEIRTLVESASDSNVFTDADHTKLNAIEASATADQTSGEIKTLLQSDKLTASEIADSTITSTQIATGALDGRYYTETELNAGQLDNRYYTESESDARYFNISTGDTIKDGDTFPDNDTTIATTAAINDRIIDLVDDVGGFVPIANETSFPNANPDVNNGAGTLVSIKALSSNLTSNGSGVATISNGTVGNSTVTINGLANSTTYAANFGMIVETTTTLNTYTFHRQVPIATEVSTVAGSISNVNTVAGSISNVNTVAGNNSNVTTVAGANSNITAVAGSISNVNTVATNISNVNDFSDKYRVASSAPTSSLDTGDLYFDTTANELKVYNGSAWQGGVTATGNLAGLGANTFTGNQSLGDNLKVQFGAGNDLQLFHDGSNSYVKDAGSGILILDASQVQINNAGSTENLAKFIPDGAVELYYDNSKKLETTSYGIAVTGTIAPTNHVNLVDDKKAQFGTGYDLQVYHNGLNSYVKNSTGWLVLGDGGSGTVIKGATNENAVSCTANGAVEIYYDGSKKLETTSGGIDVDGSVTANDIITAGALLHEGDTDTLVHFSAADTIDLKTGNVVRLTVNNSGVNLGANLYSAGKNISVGDSSGSTDDRLQLGDSQDLQIYHDGTNNIISSSNGQIQLLKGTSETLATFGLDGAVELYYDGSKKFETDANGATVTGNIYTDGNVNLTADNKKIRIGAGEDLQIYHSSNENIIGVNTVGQDIFFKSSSSSALDTTSFVVRTDGSVTHPDSIRTKWGTSDDLQIYHDGSNSWIKEVGTGILFIDTNGGHIRLSSDSNTDTMANFFKDGSVELYYDNSSKFKTTSTGVEVNGRIDGISGGHLDLRTLSAHNIQLRTNNTLRYNLQSDGHFVPYLDSTYDLGTNATRFRNVYADTLYGSGANLTNLPAGGNTFTAVANGSIATNKAVKIDTDGKVSQIDSPLGRLAGSGTSAAPVNPQPVNNGNTTIDSGFNNWQTNAWNTTTGKGIAIWNDDGDQKCQGFKVNTSTRAITASGSVVTLHTGGNDGSHNTVCHITGNKFFVCYRDGGNDVLKARIVTYDSSDGTCTISSETSTGKNGKIWGKSAVLDPDTGLVALAYRDDDDSGHGYVMMATVTGSTPSFHTAVEFHGDPAEFISMCYDTNANRLVIACRGDANKLPSFVGTVSGTSTSWSSHIGIESLDPAWTTVCFDSTNNRVFAFWNTGPQKFKVSVGTVATSGNSVTWTTPQQWLTFAGNAAKIECAYDPTLDVVMTCYQDNSDSLKAMARMFWYDSNATGDVGIGSFRILYGAASAYAACSHMYQDSFACGWNQNNSTYHLTSVRGGGFNPNLSNAEHYVGFSDAAYTNGQTATIKTYGNTVDTLSGLTAGTNYYVQADGTLASSWDSSDFSSFASNTPLAGLALSSSKLLIRDPLAKT